MSVGTTGREGGRGRKQGSEARGERLLSHGLRSDSSHPGRAGLDPALPPQ